MPLVEQRFASLVQQARATGRRMAAGLRDEASPPEPRGIKNLSGARRTAVGLACGHAVIEDCELCRS